MINSRFEKLFDRPRRKPESTLEVFHADVARSLQVVTEEIMLKLTAHVHKMTSLKNLCLAGGVALNCVANGRILKEGPFENLWIQPAAGDSGGAVGAAYIAWHHVEGKERLSRLGDAQLGSFLGPEFGDPEIEDSFRKFGIAFKKWSKQELLEKTASILSEQKIVGWFQGKMEFGPRALGARSILGDPRNPEMQKRMNLKIKFRESFRPFAPSVLIEDTKQYFNLEAESPYMLLTCAAKEEVTSVRAAVGSNWISERLGSVQGRLPAVTHVDGSARVHTVERLRNPIFYELLKTFRNKTGCPVLINTSFNVRGEPIVCTPEDAIVCFLRTEIDVLVIGSYIAERSVQDPAIIDAIRKQAKNYEPD